MYLEMDPGYTVQALPAMAPLQDPAFSWVIRTNSINETCNLSLFHPSIGILHASFQAQQIIHEDLTFSLLETQAASVVSQYLD